MEVNSTIYNKLAIKIGIAYYLFSLKSENYFEQIKWSKTIFVRDRL